VCDAPTIEVTRGRNPLAPVASITQVDRSNDAFTPNQGFRVRLDLEHASRATLSDFQYNRVAATGSMYFRAGPRATIGTRLRLGWVASMTGTNTRLGVTDQGGRDIIHPRKRFYSGGSRSVRGYNENQLGPRVLTISPTELTDSALAQPCTTADLQAGTCDPNIAGVGSDRFQPQPLGGTTIAEATVEYRFPLAIVAGLDGAVFIDGAIVGTDRFTDLLGATGAVTPGFGLRFATPAGPVRLDLGIRPTLVERLPVITEVTDSAGSSRLVTLRTLRRYDPVDTRGTWYRRILNRLMLHLAIGPAF
jgi:outer membrane protein insertion porin family/translocation and assembly module TamA